MTLPTAPEMLEWGEPARSTYEAFASFDYVNSTTRALPNTFTVS